MAGNTIGKLYQLTSFGESHGKMIGGIIEGFPSGFELDLEFIQNELNRRSPKGFAWETARKESDQIEFISGLLDNKATGSPITFLIKNKDVRSKDYDHIEQAFRPSHADFAYFKKYGIRDHRGGGRSSARETACRVVGGAIAKCFLKSKGIHINSYTKRIGSIEVPKIHNIQVDIVNADPLRCPDPAISKRMLEELSQIKEKGDTLGGIINCVISGMKSGLGEPVFDKINADLAKAMLSINSVKGFEIGSGFDGAKMKGSEHNDLFYVENEQIKTRTNYSGGVQGGISNGEDIYFSVAFKPISSIMMEQKSVDSSKREVLIPPKGRHDVCVVPRAGVIVESMAAMIIMDHYLRNLINSMI